MGSDVQFIIVGAEGAAPNLEVVDNRIGEGRTRGACG